VSLRWNPGCPLIHISLRLPCPGMEPLSIPNPALGWPWQPTPTNFSLRPAVFPDQSIRNLYYNSLVCSVKGEFEVISVEKITVKWFIFEQGKWGGEGRVWRRKPVHSAICTPCWHREGASWQTGQLLWRGLGETLACSPQDTSVHLHSDFARQVWGWSDVSYMHNACELPFEKKGEIQAPFPLWATH
jgi:hypothetical protein